MGNGICFVADFTQGVEKAWHRRMERVRFGGRDQLISFPLKQFEADILLQLAQQSADHRLAGFHLCCRLVTEPNVMKA